MEYRLGFKLTSRFSGFSGEFLLSMATTLFTFTFTELGIFNNVHLTADCTGIFRKGVAIRNFGWQRM